MHIIAVINLEWDITHKNAYDLSALTRLQGNKYSLLLLLLFFMSQTSRHERAGRPAWCDIPNQPIWFCGRRVGGSALPRVFNSEAHVAIISLARSKKNYFQAVVVAVFAKFLNYTWHSTIPLKTLAVFLLVLISVEYYLLSRHGMYRII